MSNLQPPSYTYQLETLLKNLPGMAYRCLNLPHWPMDFVSDGCLQLSGYANHEIVSQEVLWGDFTHPDDIDFVEQEVRVSADSGRSFECEYRIRTKDGIEKWVWERGQPIDYLEDGTAVIEGFITDVTEKKHAEMALRRAEKEVREHRELLSHVDRINSMGEMASAMAHELNQPLTAISLYATTAQSLFEKDSPSTERVADVLQKLTLQSHRAGAVLERMQKMTKHRESYQETVDCQTMLEEVHKLAEVEARLRNFTIALSVDNDLPKTHCDAIQIQQVILNLLRNGMEAVDEPDEDGETIILEAHDSRGEVTISIVDGGSGISKSSAEQLYQPFRSSKEEGMGLGLSISKSIINAHGSELMFTNNPIKGATFYFTLPVARNES
jgi:PAS domain S-box-containing protein